jgi:DNA repair ATPase RecN
MNNPTMSGMLSIIVNFNKYNIELKKIQENCYSIYSIKNRIINEIIKLSKEEKQKININKYNISKKKIKKFKKLNEKDYIITKIIYNDYKENISSRNPIVKPFIDKKIKIMRKKNILEKEIMNKIINYEEILEELIKLKNNNFTIDIKNNIQKKKEKIEEIEEFKRKYQHSIIKFIL